MKKEAKAEWKEGTWGEDQQRAWETLKGALLCRPVLSLPRKDLHWRLATDASNVAMGAVLSQYDNDNVEHPIGFYSRKLNDSETRWVIWELECRCVGIDSMQTILTCCTLRIGYRQQSCSCSVSEGSTSKKGKLYYSYV